MARLAKVAVCSTPNTVLGESDEERYQFNLGKAEELLHEAAAQGAEIACLPEAFTIRGISDGGTNHRWREPVPGGETYQRMAAISRQHRMYVVAPVVGVEDGVHRNVAMVIGRDGEYVGAATTKSTSPSLRMKYGGSPPAIPGPSSTWISARSALPSATMSSSRRGSAYSRSKAPTSFSTPPCTACMARSAGKP